MSLGLVAYDDSDGSDTETDNTSDLTHTNVLPPSKDIKSAGSKPNKTNKEDNTSISDEEGDSGVGVAKLHIPESRTTLLNTDIDIKRLTSSNKKNGPVKITIPSLNEIETDAEEPAKKKLKPSKKGSGLFALLPDPKSKLVPQSVSRRNNAVNSKPNTVTKKVMKPVTKPQVKTSLINYEDSGDEEESSGTDFFSLDSKDNEVPVEAVVSLPEIPPTEPVPPKVTDDALQFSESFQPSVWQESGHSTVHQPPSQYPTEEFMSVSNTDLELDQEAMQQLCGRRDRLKMQEVSLIDVSGDTIMPDSREWLTKQMTEEQAHRPSHKKRDGPTSQQKRKHQITYLAYQAKENELELKNQWANNRMTRKQTQAKYGF